MVSNSRLLILICIFCIIQQSFSLSCGSCKREECAERTCKYGTTRDPCKCCDVCAKGPGEECGGPWGLSGKCAEDLDCTFIRLPEGAHFYFFRTGICLPSNIPLEDNMTR